MTFLNGWLSNYLYLVIMKIEFDKIPWPSMNTADNLSGGNCIFVIGKYPALTS